jgi:quinol monooxygenase YgiN
VSVIEIIQFTTHPGTTAETLQQALGQLDQELARIGGFQDRTLYQDAGTENGWLLDYRWETLTEAQESMSKVAATDAFAQLMTLVADPQAMSMNYGIPAQS